jgi:hypothetical protein
MLPRIGAARRLLGPTGYTLHDGMRRCLLVLTISALAWPSVAAADGGGATIRSLPESTELQVSLTVEHSCPGFAYGQGESCDWFGEAAAYGAGGCPVVFDGSHGIWVGPVQTAPGSSSASVAFNPSRLPRDVVVCLYVYAEGSSALVGQSHPFDRSTGREILPPSSNLPGQPVPGGACRKVRVRGVNWSITIEGRGAPCRVARPAMTRFLSTGRKSRTLADGWRCKRFTMDGEPWAQCVRHDVSILASHK